MPEDICELVARARRRDAEAWEAVYRLAHARLHAYARRRLGRDDADDAVSETMARALQAIDRFTWTGVGIDAWLFGILRNVVFETYQRSTREPLAITVAEDRVDLRGGPVELVLAAEDARQVHAGLDRLGLSDRRVLELRFVMDLDAASTGALLGKSAGAVRMAQARALERLRSQLADHDEGAGP